MSRFTGNLFAYADVLKIIVLRSLIMGLNLKYWLVNRLRLAFTYTYIRSPISNSDVGSQVDIHTPDTSFNRYPALQVYGTHLYLFYYAFQRGWRIFVNRDLSAYHCLTPASNYSNDKGPSVVRWQDRFYVACHSGFRGQRRLKLYCVDPDTLVSSTHVLQPASVHGDLNYPFITADDNRLYLFFSVRHSQTLFENFVLTGDAYLNWTTPRKIELPGGQGRRLQCYIHEDSRFHVVWETKASIYYAVTTDLLKWESYYCIDTKAQRPKLTWLAGKLYVTYEKHERTGNFILLVRLDDLSFEKTVLVSSFGYVSRPANLVLFENQLICAWTQHHWNNERIRVQYLSTALTD